MFYVRRLGRALATVSPDTSTLPITTDNDAALLQHHQLRRHHGHFCLRLVLSRPLTPTSSDSRITQAPGYARHLDLSALIRSHPHLASAQAQPKIRLDRFLRYVSCPASHLPRPRLILLNLPDLPRVPVFQLHQRAWQTRSAEWISHRHACDRAGSSMRL
jgi:hypothetical protein